MCRGLLYSGEGAGRSGEGGSTIASLSPGKTGAVLSGRESHSSLLGPGFLDTEGLRAVHSNTTHIGKGSENRSFKPYCWMASLRYSAFDAKVGQSISSSQK